MKRILIPLVLFALFQSGIALAQDDGFGGRHGRNREDVRVEKSQSSPDSKADKSRDSQDNQGEVRREIRQEKQQESNAVERRQPTGSNRMGRNKSETLHPAQGNANREGIQGTRVKTEGNSPLSGSSDSLNRRNEASFGRDREDGRSRQSNEKVVGNRVGEDFNRPSRGPSGGEGRPGQEFKNGLNGNNSRKAEPHPLPARIQKMGVRSVPEPIREHNRILTADRNHSIVKPPSADLNGRALTAKPFSPSAISGKAVRNHMATIVNNASFTAQINVYNNSENRRNNYYWHTWSGVNYCHYYDDWGYHWYGWYLGPRFFWTRWYYNNWWWYDSAFNRWCYWHDGGWWWQDPFHVNVVYVYNNGNYTSCDTAPSSNFGNDGSQVVYQSNDGSRKVKVMGDARDAFLYDTTGNNAFNPVYLASGVKEVKFSNTENYRPLQIMLTLQDGSFELFDAYGNVYRGGN